MSETTLNRESIQEEGRSERKAIGHRAMVPVVRDTTSLKTAEREGEMV